MTDYSGTKSLIGGIGTSVDTSFIYSTLSAQFTKYSEVTVTFSVTVESRIALVCVLLYLLF